MSFLQPSTIQLLRFRFSFLLLPVYLFALFMVMGDVNITHAIRIGLLLHLLLYPASNGYNSYMDRDEESIGGVRNPMQPDKELFYVTVLMDIAGILLSLFISIKFAALYAVYIIFSRLYSYRGVRLKQYPYAGYLTVVVNQGALIFYMVFTGVSRHHAAVPWQGMVVSSLLIGAFYPISQIYQHIQDRKDGVTTISYKLGIMGTFAYCCVLYLAAFAIIAWYLYSISRLYYMIILQAWFLPVIIRFAWWAIKCSRNRSKANFDNTMKMNWIAATCTNLAFLTLIILNKVG